jgi:hypothetical protein
MTLGAVQTVDECDKMTGCEKHIAISIAVDVRDKARTLKSLLEHRYPDDAELVQKATEAENVTIELWSLVVDAEVEPGHSCMAPAPTPETEE